MYSIPSRIKQECAYEVPSAVPGMGYSSGQQELFLRVCILGLGVGGSEPAVRPTAQAAPFLPVLRRAAAAQTLWRARAATMPARATMPLSSMS